MDKQHQAQYDEAYSQGIFSAFDGATRQVSNVYENPQAHTVEGFCKGWDDQKLAETKGESLY